MMRFKKHAGAAVLQVLLCGVMAAYAQQAGTVNGAEHQFHCFRY